MAGMLLAVLACSFLAKRIEVAKLYYFESAHDRLFRRMNARGARRQKRQSERGFDLPDC